jgi:uridine kinase
MTDTVIVAIAGNSGSGKSTIAEQIQKHYGEDNCEIISSDFYYKGLCPNYDIPDSIEFDFLVRQLYEYLKLKDGEIIKLPQYNFKIHQRKTETLDVPRKKIVLVDGILVLFVKELQALFDLKIAVNIHAARSAIYRLRRDIKDRNRTLDEATKQYLETVLPAQEEFLEPSLKTAHLVIDNNGKLEDLNIAPAIARIDELLAKKVAAKSVYAMNITTFPQPVAQTPSASVPFDVEELSSKVMQLQLGS